MSDPSVLKDVAIPPDKPCPNVIQGLHVLLWRIVVISSPLFSAKTWTRRSDLSTAAIEPAAQPIWFHCVQPALRVCMELKIDPSAQAANASSLPAPSRSTATRLIPTESPAGRASVRLPIQDPPPGAWRMTSTAPSARGENTWSAPVESRATTGSPATLFANGDRGHEDQRPPARF